VPMWKKCRKHTATSLVEVTALRTGKIIKNCLRGRGGKLSTKGILHCVYRLS